MGECRICEGDEELSFRCNQCDHTFCSNHRLPEAHNCAQLLQKSPSWTTATEADTPGDRSSISSPRDGAVDAAEVRDSDPDNPPRAWPWQGVLASWRYKGDCPNCGKWISRRGGDKFTKCYRCGWKPGLPGVRISTHWRRGHVQKRRIRRVKKYGLYTVLLFALALIVVPSVHTGVAPIDVAANDTRGLIDETVRVIQADSGVDDEDSTSYQSGQGGASGDGGTISEPALEQAVHERINDRRRARGLSTLGFDDALQSIADYHSADMAQKNYFSHDSPTGETMEDRYDAFGYDCRVDAGGNRYLTGAENIYKTSYSGQYYSVEEIADNVVNGWMNSTGHRKNIVTSEWNNEGIGVEIIEEHGETRIYVTQNFC